MKKLYTFYFLAICFLISNAQSVPPQAIAFQGVAIDPNGFPVPSMDEFGNPLRNEPINIRFSILDSDNSGAASFYSEEHAVVTDQYGRFSLEIGRGTPNGSNQFEDIDWANGTKFLKVEIDLTGTGVEYVTASIQEMLSVPFALYAANAINDQDIDPTNELQTITRRSDTIVLTNGGFVKLPNDQVNDPDADPTNELQQISRSNDTIYLTQGGFVILPVDLVNDADADPTNEIQTLSKNGSIISLSSGGSVSVFDGNYNNLYNAPTIPTKTSDLTNDSGFLTTEVDGSVTNELQFISISGDTLYLSNGGYVVLPSSFDGDYNHLTNKPSIPTKTSDIINDSGFLTAEIDGSVTNELQSISISKDSIHLTNGGSLKLPNNNDNDSTNELQTLFVNNDSLFLTQSDGGLPLSALSSSMTSGNTNTASQSFSTNRKFNVASSTSPYAISYIEALRYCSNLLEGGHSDWRLATMDEIMYFVENASSFPSTGINTWVKVNNPDIGSYSGYRPLFGLRFELNGSGAQFYGQPISAHAASSADPIATYTCNCFREDAGSNPSSNSNPIFQITGDTTFTVPVGETWEVLSISVDVNNPPTYTWNATCYNSSSYRCYPASSLVNFISLGSTFQFNYQFPIKCVYGSCGTNPSPTRTETVSQSLMPSFINYPVILNAGDQVSLNYSGFILNARVK